MPYNDNIKNLTLAHFNFIPEKGHTGSAVVKTDF